MPVLTHMNEVIPGYRLLTLQQQQLFESTVVGENLVRLISSATSSKSWVRPWTWFTSNALSAEAIEHLQASDDYQALIRNIQHGLLLETYPDYALLNAEQQRQLIETNAARALFPNVPGWLVDAQDAFNEQDFNKVADLNRQIDAALTAFHEQLATDPNVQTIRHSIAEEKARYHPHALENAILRFYQQEPPNPTGNHPNPTVQIRLEREALTHFIQSILTDNTQGLPTIFSIEAFNHRQAQCIAHELFDDSIAVNDTTALQFNDWLDDWLAQYHDSLQSHLMESLTQFHKTPRAFEAPVYGLPIRDLLSPLYTHHLVANSQASFFTALDKFADAHAFIQATGFATQNEHSGLSWLDMYNYSRSQEYIAASKQTIYRFLHPFIPLFNEYNNISQHETNAFWHIARTLIPMLIVATVVAIVAALLSPLWIPEAAFLFILFPTLYVGGLVATAYVLTKDHVYHTLRHWYYGGAFAIPEYQVNARMERGLLNQQNAHDVQAFYIQEIQRCLATEARYQTMEPGALSSEELAQRKKNAERKDLLLLEWYDIHSNTSVGCDQLPTIVMTRLQQDGKQQLNTCQQNISHQRTFLTTWTNQTLVHVKKAFAPPSEEDYHRQHRFFESSPCFEPYETIQSLDQLAKPYRVMQC